MVLRIQGRRGCILVKKGSEVQWPKVTHAVESPSIHNTTFLAFQLNVYVNDLSRSSHIYSNVREVLITTKLYTRTQSQESNVSAVQWDNASYTAGGRSILVEHKQAKVPFATDKLHQSQSCLLSYLLLHGHI